MKIPSQRTGFETIRRIGASAPLSRAGAPLWVILAHGLSLVACSAPVAEPEQPPISSARKPAPQPPKATAPEPLGTVEAVPFTSLGHTTCVSRGEGRWRCWGSTAYAALGTSVRAEVCGTAAYPSPCVRRPVDFVGPTDAVALAGDGETYCALGKDGHVACWGRQYNGALGLSQDTMSVCSPNGDVLSGCAPGSTEARCQPDRSARCATTPRPIADLAQAVSLRAGSGFFCALRSDGTAACWGSDFRGRLGIAKADRQECGSLPKGHFVGGGTGFECSPVPRPVAGLTSLVEIATGAEFGAARAADGRVFTWGFDIAGQLGRGGSAAPAEVPGLRGAAALALGLDFACARKPDGTLACWGSHTAGSSGVGARQPDEYGVIRIPRPEPVTGLAGVRSTGSHAVASHMCAVRDDDTVACWGANDMGQLGTGDRQSRDTPTPVPGLAGVARVVVGNLHTCAELRSGEVLCWGANQRGQLGTTRPLATCGLPYIADSSDVPCSLSPVPVEAL